MTSGRCRCLADNGEMSGYCSPAVIAAAAAPAIAASKLESSVKSFISGIPVDGRQVRYRSYRQNVVSLSIRGPA